MSSSGLIYAVIVGAWAAYLVPMWLRRQDELNDSRPTERFSTAIRLLSGRAAMERRHAKERAARGDASALAAHGDDTGDPDGPHEAADVRAFADPTTAVHHTPEPENDPEAPTELHSPSAHGSPKPPEERSRRARVLARRRRTTMVLFLSFTLGAIIAAVGGLRFLWAPAIPAVLLSAYIVHLRAQERRRFAVRLDQRNAEAAARELRERRRPRPEPTTEPDPAPVAGPTEDRQALVEQTDHAEWVDQQQRDPGGWDPVPVPLPTYVNAPVAPRTTSGVDLDAPDTWSSARSTTANPTPPPCPETTQPPAHTTPNSTDHQTNDPTTAHSTPPAKPRKPRQRGRTPLFDQYAEQDRPRAANE